MTVRKAASARPDKRYKNADEAPPIVSEKRLTFFLAESVFRELRMQCGLCQVHNANVDADLPESPSAMVREAVEFWLDQFRPKAERTRSDDEWAGRIRQVLDAGKRLGK